jgi:hypothetical protein
MSADEIKSWTALPYWIPETVGKDAPEILLESDLGVEPMGALPSPPLPLTAMNPCRIVDTRNAPGPFGGPALVANATRTFSIPSGPCAGIPSDASAYSLNFTVIGGSGVFTNAFLTAWSTGNSQPTVSTLNFNANQLEANAAVVPAGTSGSINVFVNAPGNLLIDINGYYRAIPMVNTVNALSGDVTLAAGSNVTITPSGQTLTVAATGGPGGVLPTGTVNQTMRHNGTSWVASDALTNDGEDVGVTGALVLPYLARARSGLEQIFKVDLNDQNTFFGGSAGGASAPGLSNTGIGYRALRIADASSSGNVAVGPGALDDSTSGDDNTAIGLVALQNVTTGSRNISIGAFSGANISSGNDNIYIGNPGSGNESGQIRIGNNAVHTQGTVIASIYGFLSSGGIPVYVTSGGRLGTNTSSGRFKVDVRDIAAGSEGLMSLRPVAFRYKPELDPSRLPQYGLIAEEVAEIYPELVVYDEEGRPEAIRSQLLQPLFLNELQKQRRTIDAQRAELDELKAKLGKLEALMREGKD